MKYILLFLCLPVSLASAQWVPSDNCEYSAVFVDDWQVCYPPNWDYRLVIYDEFEGDHLDRSLWKYSDNGVMNDLTFETAKQWLQPQNCEISSGTLKIMAKQENVIRTWVSDYSTTPFTYRTDTFDYTSGWIETNNKLGYGIYEIRCKVPYGKGLWPAFWLFGLDGSYYNEIDVFEFNARPGVCDAVTLSKTPVSSLYYYNGPDPGTKCSQNIPMLTNLTTDFHTYAVEWDYYYTAFYIDGDLKILKPHYVNYYDGSILNCNTMEPMDLIQTLQRFPRSPMNPILSMGVQRGFDRDPFTNAITCSRAPNDNSIFPATYEIDYFKYYKKTLCNANYSYASYADVVSKNSQSVPGEYLTNLDYKNILTGKNLSLVSGLTMNLSTNPTQQSTHFLASESIMLTPDVFIDKYSPTMLFIDPDLCSTTRILVNENGLSMNNTSTYSETDDLQNETNKDKLISLYPNPTSDYIYFNANESSLYQIMLINSLGQPVLEVNNLSNNSQLSLISLPAGMYNILIFNENIFIKNEKIIKK